MRAGTAFILITVLIDSMGIGLIIPVMPALIREVQGTGLQSAVLWGAVLSVTFAVMQFLFGPLLGNLSDRFGRRPIMLISLVVLALDYLVMAVAGSIWILLAGRVVGGITAATHATANAYMADISTPEQKSTNFGLAGAAFGLGFVLGPAIGGVLAEFGTRAPFYAAALLATANAIFGYFVLRETVTDRIRRPFSWRRANPFGAFRQLNNLPGIRALLVVYFLYQMAFGVYPAVWAYYTQLRFGWSEAVVGLSLALFGVSLAIVQGGLIRPAIRVLGERGAVIYGLAADVVFFVLTALIWSGLVLLALTPIAALAGVITPALQSIMSQQVSDDAQGELQGAMTSVAAIAMILSYAVMSVTFWQFSGADGAIYLPGAPFLLSSALVGLGLVVFLRRA
ncbi:MFS transporter [Aliishimia ponticola]|uniref:MFS transporter n=1 Tax=Aliishimia ponticola TaxID=2499833 RepID=A0A4S4NCH2_9RHOB|nr:TCR/Tet family MFS transporter [Aliishimia ponticola]THH37122.1 MFS transporter [Aliishimia ponticola]